MVVVRTRQCSGGCNKTVVTSVSASSIASGVSTLGCCDGVPVALLIRPLLLLACPAAELLVEDALLALLEPLEFLRCVRELMMEVERMGLRKGCILTLEAAMMRMEAASIWEVVPTVSYFFSLT